MYDSLSEVIQLTVDLLKDAGASEAAAAAAAAVPAAAGAAACNARCVLSMLLKREKTHGWFGSCEAEESTLHAVQCSAPMYHLVVGSRAVSGLCLTVSKACRALFKFTVNHRLLRWPFAAHSRRSGSSSSSWSSSSSTSSSSSCWPKQPRAAAADSHASRAQHRRNAASLSR